MPPPSSPQWDSHQTHLLERIDHRLTEMQGVLETMAVQQSDFDAAVKALSDAVDQIDAKIEALKAQLASGVQVTQADLDAITAITTKATTELNAP